MASTVTLTWDGGSITGDNWNTSIFGSFPGRNWDFDQNPANSDDLRFAGNNRLSNNNNTPNGWNYSINFDSNAGAFTVGGNRVVLTNSMVNSSTNLQTINLPLTLESTRSFDPGSGGIQINGVINGAGGLTKVGNGVLTLTGANTFTGATQVNPGTLVVNGSLATGSTVTIDSVLSGTGTLGGNTTIQDGGTLAPGPVGGIGPISFSNDLTFDSGSVFEWDFSGNAQGTRGTNYDAVNVSGGLSVDPGAVFRVVLGSVDFIQSFWSNSTSWTDIFGGATPSGGGFTNLEVVGAPANLATFGSFSVSGTTISWTAIPEPTTALAGLLLVAGMLRRKR